MKTFVFTVAIVSALVLTASAQCDENAVDTCLQGYINDVTQ